MKERSKRAAVAVLAGVMTMGMLAGCGEKKLDGTQTRNRYSHGSIKHYGPSESGSGGSNVRKPYGRTGRIFYLGI